MLVFVEQELTDQQQIDFSRLFGPLESSVTAIRRDTKSACRGLAGRSLQSRREQRISAPTTGAAYYNLGNQLWHTDSSFKRVPARAALLYARPVPPYGGCTEVADLRAAYDALPEDMKRKLEGLVAEHSIFCSRAKTGFTNFSPEEREQLPPVPQVVVRTHPGSKRRTLYIASHADHIIGWPLEEGRRLLAELIEHATQRQFVYTHRWRVNDLVMGRPLHHAPWPAVRRSEVQAQRPAHHGVGRAHRHRARRHPAVA